MIDFKSRLLAIPPPTMNTSSSNLIHNPATGRMVKADGKIGKRLIATIAPAPTAEPIVDPATLALPSAAEIRRDICYLDNHVDAQDNMPFKISPSSTTTHPSIIKLYRYRKGRWTFDRWMTYLDYTTLVVEEERQHI